MHYRFRRSPPSGGMTGIATRRGRHMPDGFPRRLQGIVASRALPGHIARVLHDRACKRGLVMAILTLLASRD
jgi:hypothetical protein